MKTTLISSIRITLTLSFAAVLLVFSSCGDPPDPQPTEGELVLQSLASGNWKVNSATIDGVDKTSMFTGLTISFTSSQSSGGKPTAFSGSYTSTNGDPVWPTSGTWSITDQATAGSLQRSDDVIVQLTEVTNTSAKLGLTWNKKTFGGGRTGSVQGQYVFVMGR